jgi:ribose transport system substrate-binding protein
VPGIQSVRTVWAAKDSYKMVFIQFMPHTVPAGWSQGIEEVLKVQSKVKYQLLDGQGKVDVQIDLMNTASSQWTVGQ